MAAPGTPDRACWACGVTASALRKRSKGQRLLLALPADGLLVLAQAAAALGRLGAGPDGAPCGRPATHVLDGLCANCWVKNDQELKRRAQAQSTVAAAPEGAAVAAAPEGAAVAGIARS